jgi:hypothetical protein
VRDDVAQDLRYLGRADGKHKEIDAPRNRRDIRRAATSADAFDSRLHNRDLLGVEPVTQQVVQDDSAGVQLFGYPDNRGASRLQQMLDLVERPRRQGRRQLGGERHQDVKRDEPRRRHRQRVDLAFRDSLGHHGARELGQPQRGGRDPLDRRSRALAAEVRGRQVDGRDLIEQAVQIVHGEMRRDNSRVARNP